MREKTAYVSVRIDVETLDILRAWAKASHRSVPKMIRFLVDKADPYKLGIFDNEKKIPA